MMYVGMFLAALTAIDVVRAQPGGDVDSSQLTDLCDEEGGSADYSEELRCARLCVMFQCGYDG